MERPLDDADAETTPTPLPVAVDELWQRRPPRGRRRGSTLAALSLLAAGALPFSRIPRSAPLAAAAPVEAPAAQPSAQIEIAPPPVAPLTASADPRSAPAPRADAHVKRKGYAHVPHGIVFVPSTFASADGAYD